MTMTRLPVAIMRVAVYPAVVMRGCCAKRLWCGNLVIRFIGQPGSVSGIGP